MKKIDLHCHFYPKEYFDEVEKHKLFAVRTRFEVWEDTEARISDMDRFSIERQVLSLSAPFVYFEDAGLSLHLSQLVNDFAAEICRKHPDRFSGLISVPLTNVKYAVDELKRAVKAPGMVGVSIGVHIRNKLLSSPDFVPFFEEVNKMGMPVIMHPAYPLGIGNVQDYQDFYRSMGFLWETTMAVGRMAIDGVFEKYSNISWVLSHLGGTLPFVYTSMDMCQKRNPAKEPMVKKPLSSYFKNLYADTARHVTAPILSCALDLYGEDHIVYGSDIPFAYDVTSLNVPALDNFDISEKLRRKICYENAKKLLKL